MKQLIKEIEDREIVADSNKKKNSDDLKEEAIIKATERKGI